MKKKKQCECFVKKTSYGIEQLTCEKHLDLSKIVNDNAKFIYITKTAKGKIKITKR